jgi:hypothetical protein
MKANEMPFYHIYVSILRLINEQRDIRKDFHLRGRGSIELLESPQSHPPAYIIPEG